MLETRRESPLPDWGLSRQWFQLQKSTTETGATYRYHSNVATTPAVVLSKWGRGGAASGSISLR
jgi:hypothetical protein